MNPEQFAALVKFFEKIGPVAPGRLRPGCISWAVEPTAHMQDLAEIEGYGKLSFDYPPSPEDCRRHNEPERTPEEIEEVRQALEKAAHDHPYRKRTQNPPER